MTFQDAVRVCLRGYAEFGGRARRSEYWWFVLFAALASAAASTVSQDLSDLVGIALLLPGLAAAVRRLHDVDHSGWTILLVLVPFVGWIVLLVWLTTAGTAGPNRFGPEPPLLVPPR